MTNPTQQLAQLQGLLLHPREELDVEIKSWLDPADNMHKADIAKALIALANHGGGHLVIGFSEVDGSWREALARPATLGGYTQDLINGIVAGYAEPMFHCQLHHVEHPLSHKVFPVVAVPGIHSTPVRSRRDGPQDSSGKPCHVNINCYYIRRPGPKSEEPQSGQEWDQLIRRCVRTAKDELIATISALLSGSAAAPTATQRTPLTRLGDWTKEAAERRQQLLSPAQQDTFKHGTWSCAYILEGRLKEVSLKELLDILAGVKGRETGWPVWLIPRWSGAEPYVSNGMVECWMGRDGQPDPSHADYWVASPDGRLFLERGFQEDSVGPNPQPGAIFDLTLPVWRAGECLLHASRMSAALSLDSETQVHAQFRWTGLKDRELDAWSNQMRMVYPGRVSRQSEVVSTISAKADRVPGTLADLVHELTKPLYLSFDFMEAPLSMVTEEIDRMRGRRS